MSKLFSLIKFSLFLFIVLSFVFIALNNRYVITLNLSPIVESLNLPFFIIILGFYIFGILTVLIYYFIYFITSKIKKFTKDQKFIKIKKTHQTQEVSSSNKQMS